MGPLYLALGDDADEGIRQKSTTLLRHVENGEMLSEC